MGSIPFIDSTKATSSIAYFLVRVIDGLAEAIVAKEHVLDLETIELIGPDVAMVETIGSAAVALLGQPREGTGFLEDVALAVVHLLGRLLQGQPVLCPFQVVEGSLVHLLGSLCVSLESWRFRTFPKCPGRRDGVRRCWRPESFQAWTPHLEVGLPVPLRRGDPQS